MSHYIKKPLLYPYDTVYPAKYDPETEEETIADDFENNGYGFLPDGILCHVSEQINSSFEVELQYPINGYNYDNLQIGNIIMVYPHSWAEKKQPFRIYSISKPSPDGIVTVKAEHKSYELSGYPCKPNSDYAEEKGTAETLMIYLNGQSQRASNSLQAQKYTFATNITASAKWSIPYPTDIKSVMAYAVQVFGGEWEFDGAHCVLKKQRGQNRGVVVRYGSNMLSMTHTAKDDTYTHILPYWTDGEQYVYVSGDIIQVEGIQPGLKKKVIPVDLSSEFEEKPTSSELLEAAQKCSEYKDTPKITISQEVSFVSRGQTDEYATLTDADHVELGDEVGIVAVPYGLVSTERCNKIVYDVYHDSYKSAYLGAVQGTVTKTISDLIRATKDGFNVFAQADSPKTDYKTGDFWIRTSNNDEDRIKRIAQALGRYDGGNWKMLCKFEQSEAGGVGEWLDDGHTTEIFNSYKNTQFDNRNRSTLKYDHIEGSSNKSTSMMEDDFIYSGWNHIEGNHNTLYNTTNSHVGGYGNTLGVEAKEDEDPNTEWNDGNIVYGYRNICDDVARVIVVGYSNELDTVDDSAVFGETHNISAGADGMLVAGGSNTVKDGMYTTVLGNANTAENVNHSLIVGQNINVKNQDNGSLFCGRGYTINGAAAYVFVAGNGNTKFIIEDDGEFYVDNNGMRKFSVSNTGAVTASAYNTSGADYAEYFEWADGNADNEDRCGMLVTLFGDKIIPAHGDDILGAVSARASVVGNAYEEYWHGKYVTDVYGRHEPKLSPDYDQDVEYIPRSKRPEWAVVGLMGRLVVNDDGSCKVGNYVSARHGIGTDCFKNTGVKVLRRLDETHIEVLIK